MIRTEPDHTRNYARVIISRCFSQSFSRIHFCFLHKETSRKWEKTIGQIM